MTETISHAPDLELTSIFDRLCADLGLDPFSPHPRYVVVIPPRQRAIETSSFRAIEAGPKVEEKILADALTPAAPPGNVLGVGNTDTDGEPDTGSDPTTEEDTMIDAITATAAVDAAKAADVTLTVVIGEDRFTGTPVSVNSKGVNIKVDGKTRSFGLGRIDAVTADIPATEVRDGMSTREVADLFDIEAKELRVHLRKLGLGVGKGRKYGLTAADVDAVREHLATVDATPADA